MSESALLGFCGGELSMFGRKEAKRKKSLIEGAMLGNEWTPAEMQIRESGGSA
jgi:hypothetical protein